MFHHSYQDNPELLGCVFELLDQVFSGIGDHVEAAGPLGLDWGKTSTPFVRIEGGKAVSHVGVLSLPLIIAGREVTAAGIHAVCTHPDHRGRGHYRAVMSEVVEWCDGRFETALLFTDSPGMYEPFGFRVVPESRFVPTTIPPGDPARPAGLRKLDWSCRDDVALLRRLVRERSPVSTTLGVASEESVFAFNAVHLPMWYAQELDAIVSFSVDDRTVRIFDVVARRMPTWAELAAQLPAGTDRVEVCFCPDGLGLEAPAEPCAGQGHGCIMVRGTFVRDQRPLMFPRTAEC